VMDAMIQPPAAPAAAAAAAAVGEQREGGSGGGGTPTSAAEWAAEVGAGGAVTVGAKDLSGTGTVTDGNSNGR